jgi:hypothetical protein
MKFIGKLLSTVAIITATTTHAESFDVQKEVKQNQILYHVDMTDGEKVLIQDSDITLTINSIVDHRCPKGAMCILATQYDENGAIGLWEGGVEVDMDVLQGFEMQNVSIMYQENKHNKVQLADHEIEIARVQKDFNQYHLTIQLDRK